MYIVSNILPHVFLYMNKGALSLLQAPNDDLLGCVGFLVIVGIIIAALVVDSNKKAKALTEARDAYYRSLARLKADPTNPDQRQSTLKLGRVYSKSDSEETRSDPLR